MTKKEILEEMNNILQECNALPEVTAVTIAGETMYLTERQVRALQVMANRKAKISKEAFFDFVNTVQVNAAKEGNKPMIFRHDGKFVNSFEEGFYQGCGNLVFEIMGEEGLIPFKVTMADIKEWVNNKFTLEEIQYINRR